MRLGAAPRDVAVLFAETAARRGEHPALIRGRETTSFAALARDAAELGAGLLRAGLAPGERVAVLVPPSRDFYALTFGLLRAGLVPVLIDPGIGLANLGRCLDETEPAAFIGSPKAQLGRLLGGWARSARLVLTADGFFPGARGLGWVRELGRGAPAEPPAPSPDALAAILFTSGSTGAPKGALYTRGMFAAQLELLRSLFGIREGEVSMPTFPLFGLFDAALGQCCVIPDMDFTRPASADPAALVGLLQSRRVDQLFASPALLDRLARFGEAHGVALPQLRRVMSAGAPVPARVLARMRALLEPGVEVHTPYGATEALPVAVIGSDEVLDETAARTAEGRGVCVGRPVDGVELAVIRTTDEPIARWDEGLRAGAAEIGELAVRGPVVSPGYFRRPEADAAAKIRDGASVWHRMGDLGWVDEKGRVWFCGRKSQRVRAEGRDLHTAAVEGVFDAHPAVRRSALVGVRGRPVLCVEREPGAATDDEQLTRELLRLGERQPASRAVRTILYHPSFPVDVRHNAKISRETLAEWAARRLP